MSQAQQLLAFLSARDIHVTLDGDRLHVNAPKGALTPELKARLQEGKQELIALLKRTAEADAAGAGSPPIQPLPRNQLFPLSFAQRRLWLLDQLDPGDPVYNIAEALRISGPLDVSALEKSLTALVARHESIRTTFLDVDGDSLQRIGPPVQVSLPVVDAGPQSGSDPALAPRLTAAARRPFDLSQGPLLRFTLFRTDVNEHVLLLTVHHIAFDGWSFGIFYRELAALYAAATTGAGNLEPLPVQYADYSVWQLRWSQGGELQTQLAYWKAQLADLPDALPLPADKPRPPVQSHVGARHEFELSAALTGALKTLSRQHGVTLFMTLLAAFKVLLVRLTGELDVVVGAPVAGRNRVELEKLLGFFVNTVVLRTRLAAGDSFAAVLGRVRETALDAFANQETPFELIVEALQPERDLGRSPLFQVMFAYQGAVEPMVSMANLDVSTMPVDPGTAKFDLTLAIEETGAGLSGAWEYATALFEPDTIARFHGNLEMLLQGVIQDSQCSIQGLPLLTQSERSLQLQRWNDTRADYSDPPCIQQLFVEQVERTPERPALVFENERVDYRELNRRANRLAHHLIGLGVGAEVPVGICVERSVEMVVGLLGILKAGGAYVPLDPDYPRERLATMLQDAGIQVLLAQKRLLDKLPPDVSGILPIDDSGTAFSAERDENPPVMTTAESPAYVIYTSGSTGKPKGVMVPHAGIRNRLLWMQDTYRLTGDDRVLQKTSFSFDVSVWEFFWPLITGACLVVARPEGHRDSAYLARLIAEEKITTLHFVPSMLRLFLEEPGVADCNRLQRVICSGEALPLDTVEDFHSRLPAALYNLYGPTEASIDVTHWTCARDGGRDYVPIGFPIANTQIYILDARLEPLPVGAAGELCIGGIGLARGYLGRPALTAAAFVPDPFGGERGARLYRTGDLARFHGDGSIEFLGRIDQQVKLRGFRIELGEIEAVLRTHEGVRDVVVVMREETAGDQRLIAYVVPEAGSMPGLEQLRNFLRRILPDHMIPGRFVPLSEVPLTSNGKVDRGALPAPDVEDGDGTEEGQVPRNWSVSYQSPRDSLEYQLSEIWEELLNIGMPVGTNDNFFDLGGHSLLAVRMFSRIRSLFGKELPLATLFQAPTIGQLAEYLRGDGEPGKWPSLVPIQSAGQRPPVFLVPLADGVIFHLHLRLGRHLGRQQPVYGLQARGVDGVQEPHGRIEEMAAFFVSEMRAVQPQGPYRIIGICDGATVAYEMAQQLRAEQQAVALLALVVPTAPPAQVKTAPTPKTELYRQLKGHPPELARVAAAHFAARDHYVPAPYPDPVLYFEAVDDPVELSQPIRRGWEALVSGPLTRHELPGDHNTSVREPRVQVLAQHLRTGLNQ